MKEMTDMSKERELYADWDDIYEAFPDWEGPRTHSPYRDDRSPCGNRRSAGTGASRLTSATA